MVAYPRPEASRDRSRESRCGLAVLPRRDRSAGPEPGSSFVNQQTTRLDRIDMKILIELQKNGRMTNVPWPRPSACRRVRACCG